jgi:hypothetical protein
MRAAPTTLRLAAAAVVSTAVVAAPTASAGANREQTTEPTNFAIFTVKMGSSGVIFAPDPKTTSGTTGEFKIFNQSNKMRRFALAGRATKLMKPRTQTIFFLLFDQAGGYTWRSYGRNARTFKGTFEVTPGG